jgi:hypothetical protein
VSVTVLEDFDSFAIPSEVYEYLMIWKWMNFPRSQKIYLRFLEFGRR